MNRRGFLGAILAAGAAPAVVKAAHLMPIWSGSESGLLLRTPDLVITRGNQLLTIEMITREALRILHKNMVFVSWTNSEFDRESAHRGDKLHIRLPKRYGL